MHEVCTHHKWFKPVIFCAFCSYLVKFFFASTINIYKNSLSHFADHASGADHARRARESFQERDATKDVLLGKYLF